MPELLQRLPRNVITIFRGRNQSKSEQLIAEVRNSGSGFAKPSAELVQFLAYGGFRICQINFDWIRTQLPD
jgi:hypothetical protein